MIFLLIIYFYFNWGESKYRQYRRQKKDIKKSINKNAIIINQNIQDESEFLISYFSNIHYSKYNQSKQIQILEKSNFRELKDNISKLIKFSKKSLEESIKSGIINFIIYLTSK